VTGSAVEVYLRRSVSIWKGKRVILPWLKASPLFSPPRSLYLGQIW
jgi:hypothetical protein